MPDSNKIEVSRTAYLALQVSFLITLMALVFLLGRMSVPVTPVAVVPAPAASGNDDDRSRTLNTRPPQTPTTVPITVASPEPEPVVEAPAPPPEPPVPPLPAGQKKAVQAYLQAVDELTAGTGEIGDPTDFATGLLGQAAAGDTTAFDGLISGVHQAQARLQALHPPAVCKEHYHLVAAQLQGSLSLLQGVKSVAVSMDTSSLPRLALQGQRMQSENQHLQSLSKRLHRQSRL